MDKNKKDIRPKFDKKRQEKITEDFMEFALPLIRMTREEFDEYERKVRSGDIKIDNQLD